MPLSQDDKVNDLAHELVDFFRATFHTPKTDRPAHARGQFVKGTFTPSDTASSLSAAKIFSQDSTPIIARFSNSTGIPNLPDNEAAANPRGFAIRFILSEDGHTHYDIISHASNGFFVGTGEELLAFFQAGKDGKTDEFLANHPETRDFIARNPGFPKSFATEQYFGVNAFKFTNAEGKETWFRYHIVPADEAIAHYSSDEIHDKGKDYLYDELRTRLQQSSAPARFKLRAQLAEPEDPLHNATKLWPESRRQVDLGIIQIDEIWDATDINEREQKRIIYDPVPRSVDGIDAGPDPLIDLRATVYLISGKVRRAAAGVA